MAPRKQSATLRLRNSEMHAGLTNFRVGCITVPLAAIISAS
jgi:hypothetical protein